MRSRHPLRWTALATAVAAAGLVAVLASRPAAQDTLAASPLVGKPAPEITGTAFNGSPYRLSAQRGRFVLVNFFAGWCVPCRSEEPELVQLAFEHRAAGNLSIVAVAFDEPGSDAASFLRSSGAVWPGLPDASGQIALDYGVRGPPESFLVAPDGRVVAKVEGGVTAAGVDALVSRARAEDA
jgi:cytochrome c biogenesis protein CcmG, thiol:disulfide interchange protein DsbE